MERQHYITIIKEKEALKGRGGGGEGGEGKEKKSEKERPRR